jgi:hypothetical protein
MTFPKPSENVSQYYFASEDHIWNSPGSYETPQIGNRHVLIFLLVAPNFCMTSRTYSLRAPSLSPASALQGIRCARYCIDFHGRMCVVLGGSVVGLTVSCCFSCPLNIYRTNEIVCKIRKRSAGKCTMKWSKGDKNQNTHFQSYLT